MIMRMAASIFVHTQQILAPILLKNLPPVLAALERSGTGRFEVHSCKPTSGGLLPSLVQHRKLSLAFVTHADKFTVAMQTKFLSTTRKKRKTQRLVG
jgi:hypothetical protein